VFPFSERPGTPAARMPAVPPTIRRARAALLRAQAATNAAQFHAAQIGTPAQIVVERVGQTYAAGHTQHFAPVRLAGQWPHASLLSARITGANADHLLAEAA
jgi:threonylcarbamoyladenosine tRNA methylthiotransferase MtaB